MAGPQNPMLIQPESRALQQTLLSWLNASSSGSSGQAVAPETIRLHEFEDTQYMLERSEQGEVRLSFCLPDLEACWKDALLNESTLESISQAYKGLAVLERPPRQGYQVGYHGGRGGASSV